jgi:hypothetical protein
MRLKHFRLLTLILIFLSLTACARPQAVSPEQAQTRVSEAWQADQHAVWALDWPEAPTAGPLTAEIWRSGDRYRIEILEAAAPALVGEILVVDGETAWRYNRFQPAPLIPITSPVLSPVTDLFSLMDLLLQTPVVSAEQEATELNYNLTQKIRLTFSDGNELRFWQEVETGLPIRLILFARGQQIELDARQVEPLPDPLEGLFQVGEWIYH